MENGLDRRLWVYVGPKLPLEQIGATVLFQLITARYERGSIIMTSTRSFGDWGQVLGDAVLATAILNRLLHHRAVLDLRVDATAPERGDRPAPSPKGAHSA